MSVLSNITVVVKFKFQNNAKLEERLSASLEAEKLDGDNKYISSRFKFIRL